MSRSLLIALVAFGLLAARPVSAQVQYTLTPLGTLGGTSSYAEGINASGQVVGGAQTGATDIYGDAIYHAFLYSNGTMSDLGTLQGGTMGSFAYAINASGQAVGYSYTTAGTIHAFLWSNGTMQDLGTLPGGGASYAAGINTGGQVVGYSLTSGTNLFHAFLYSNGPLQDLGTIGSFANDAYATGINDNGQIAGHSFNEAFLYSNGTMHALPTLGGTPSQANGINACGQVVGWSEKTGNGSYHAFLDSNGTMTDLGTLGGLFSQANAINSSGQIIGWSGLSGSTNYFKGDAFLYEDGKMLDLNTLIPPGTGWTIDDAYAINDNGWIAVDGTNPNVNAGAEQALLLTPTPEPTSLAILALGFVGVVIRRWGARS